MTLEKQQQRVYEWLSNDLGLPVFAEAYKGAIFLLNQKPAGHVSFVAHVGRDLMNRLASTVSGIKSERVQYQQHLDRLQTEWQDEWRTSDDLTPEVREHGHFIPTQVCQRIATLLEEHKSGRLRSSEADGLFFSTFLDYNDKNRIPKNFYSEWKAAKEWFLKYAHLRKKSFKSDTESELVKHFNCLDGYLYIAASSQYERLKELNEILDITNQ
jgi:hypothetical protein